MKTTSRRFKRGDTSLERPGLVFLRYKRGKEVWATPEKLHQVKMQCRVVNAEQRAKPEHKEKMRKYWMPRNQRADVKAGRLQYYASSEVRARIRSRYAADPKRLVEAEERARQKAESEARKASPEYIESERQKAKARYERDKPIIFAKIFERRRSDPGMRLRQNLSRRIRKCMERTTAQKDCRTHELVGCTIPGFMGYLEKQFLPGMSWENYGAHGWHIDHIIPLSRFDITDPVSVRHAFNYRNCRPEWRVPNLSKSNTLDMALVAKHELWEWLPYVIDELREVA